MGPIHLNSGSEQEKLQEHAICGRQKKVAVMCWYTTSGRSIPQMIKYKDDDGCIQIISDIHTIKSEKKYYAGIAARRYDCSTMIRGLCFHFTLVYRPDDETWMLVMKE